MTNKSDNSWKKLESEVVYRNKWYSVRRDTVIRPDGKSGEYNVVEALDGVFVIALDEEKNVHLIRKYRYPTNVYSLEVPAGGIESGEKHLDAAKRELQEELGLSARNWQVLGSFQAENAYINNFAHVFIATGLSLAGQNDQLAEGIKETPKVSFEEALRMVRVGEITDSQSMSALMLAAFELGYIN